MAEEDRYPTMLPLSRVEGSVAQGSREVGPASSGHRALPPVATGVSTLLPAIVESIPTPVLVIDERLRLVLVNEAARALLGADEDSLLGYSATRFLSEQHLKAAQRALRGSEGKYSYEDRLESAGVELDLQVEANLLNTLDGGFLCLSVRDRTDEDRKRAEWSETSQDVPSDRLERAHRLEALGHLAGSLAHDFNNLLAVILGSVETAQYRMKRGLDPDQDLQRAVAAAERSIEATAQILRYSRNRDSEPTTVLPQQVLLDFQGLLERAVGSEVRLTFDLQVTLPIRVAPAQLETALLNLLVNARDAVSGDGQIEVVLEPRGLSNSDAGSLGLAPGSYVVLAVKDDGVGISEEVQSRVFEPFFTTKEQGLGTGLGLSTVQSLMRRLGGAVRLESRVGEGTLVELFFPALSQE